MKHEKRRRTALRAFPARRSVPRDLCLSNSCNTIQGITSTGLPTPGERERGGMSEGGREREREGERGRERERGGGGGGGGGVSEGGREGEREGASSETFQWDLP